MMRFSLFLAMLATIALTGCDTSSPNPQDQYWETLQSYCGKAYAGQLVSQDAVDADFQGAEMVMHIRECTEERIAIPFHVRKQGEKWDRSRTWIITRQDNNGNPGLRLKHDHRHADGAADAVTIYGGDTADTGTSRSQSFPVDAESIAMFKREGLDASVTNIWTVEVDPPNTEDAVFAYQLQRTMAEGAPEDRLFRVEFDLTRPALPPPPPWGT